MYISIWFYQPNSYSYYIQIGDKVRVSSAIPEPTRGWGGVNGSSVGEVKEVTGSEGQEEITVEFPECNDWVGVTRDLEFHRELVVGDSVQVIKYTALLINGSLVVAVFMVHHSFFTNT